MSGDLMYKGIMELVEAKADTITADDYIPVYQKRTLQVMKVRVGDLVSAIARLAIEETVNLGAETSGFAVIGEEEGPVVVTEAATQDEILELELESERQKPKTRGRKKKNEQS